MTNLPWACPTAGTKKINIIRTINETGRAVRLVEQIASQALRTARRARSLETGRFAMSGESSSMISDPQVKRA